MTDCQLDPECSCSIDLPTDDQRKRIRDLNDDLRRTGRGGRIVLSTGIAALPETTIGSILTAVANFDRFDQDNDPHGEHDFGLLTVGDRQVIWKIDYYDLDLSGHSPDESDPAVTKRVLTIMLADEY
jgi:hypothetical protein